MGYSIEQNQRLTHCRYGDTGMVYDHAGEINDKLNLGKIQTGNKMHIMNLPFIDPTNGMLVVVPYEMLYV